MGDDYSDLDDEIRPHLADYVRDVIATGRAYYPEALKLLWPQTRDFWRHREAFYVALVRLYADPEAAARWELTPAEVAEYKRIHANDEFVRYANPLDAIEIRCDVGWNGVLRQMLNEINAADVKVVGLVAYEDQGRLRIDYAEAELWLSAAKIFLLAEFRSYYTCETCGRPGEHRVNSVGWKHTRCSTHRPAPPNDGTAIFTQARTPWRRMSDGDFAYDPVGDRLERMTERLSERYEEFFYLSPIINLDPEAEAIVDHVLRRIADLPLAADYRIGSIKRDRQGYLVVEDNIYSLPDTPARDLMMAFWASADDRVAKLPKT